MVTRFSSVFWPGPLKSKLFILLHNSEVIKEESTHLHSADKRITAFVGYLYPQHNNFKIGFYQTLARNQIFCPKKQTNKNKTHTQEI